MTVTPEPGSPRWLMGDKIRRAGMNRYFKAGDYGRRMPQLDKAKFFQWRGEFYDWITKNGGPPTGLVPMSEEHENG